MLGWLVVKLQSCRSRVVIVSAKAVGDMDNREACSSVHSLQDKSSLSYCHCLGSDWIQQLIVRLVGSPSGTADRIIRIIVIMVLTIMYIQYVCMFVYVRLRVRSALPYSPTRPPAYLVHASVPTTTRLNPSPRSTPLTSPCWLLPPSTSAFPSRHPFPLYHAAAASPAAPSSPPRHQTRPRPRRSRRTGRRRRGRAPFSPSIPSIQPKPSILPPRPYL